MALTLSIAARNAAVNGIVDLIDGGAGDGYIEIGTSGMGTLLVTCNFGDPAFGDAASGTATANAMDQGTAVADGTAAEARIRDSDATDIITGLTVGTTGTDIILSNTAINTNDTVDFSSMTVTMPAS